MTIQQYAPVAIPTLNRYDHFRKCLESLERCTGADKTDVYVALDFPPSEKYRRGWEDIDKYLREKELNNKFKKLVVIRREKNYGVGHPNSNGSLLLKSIKGMYDRYIFSEDDNVFSPNFLDFINKGLEMYKDDMRILQVCGYNYQIKFPKSYKNNFYFSKNGSPWGYGSWVNRDPIISKYRNLDVLGNLIKDKESVKTITIERAASIINMLKHNSLYGDTIYGCIGAIEDMYFLMPTVSKVKNIGDDGTGVHSKSKNKKVIDFFQNQMIDTDEDFNFTNDIFTIRPYNIEEKKMPKSFLKEKYKKMVFKIDYYLWRHFNFVPKSKYI